MKRILQTLLLGAALSLTVSGCNDDENSSMTSIGGGSPPVGMQPDPDPDPDPNPDPQPDSVTLNIGVFAPMQNQTAEPEKASGYELLASLFGSEAFAQAARPGSFMPVNDATLEVQVIAPNGSVARTITADVTPLGNGRYQITLPPGEDIASDCIVVASDALNMPLRVPLVERNIDITPVTEFLTSRLTGTPEDPRNYANISLDEVRELIDQVSGIVIPEDRQGSVEDIVAALSEIAGEDIAAAVVETEAANEQPADDPAVAFATYDAGLLQLGMQGFDGGDDPNAAPRANGSFDVSGGPFGITIRDDGNDGAEAFVDSEFEDFRFELFNRQFGFGSISSVTDSFQEPVRILSDGSIVIAGSSEQSLPPAGDLNADGEAIGSIESYPSTTLYAAADGEILLETYRERVSEYVAIDNNGDDVPDQLDLNQARSTEFFAEPNIYVRRPSDLQSSDFSGQYGTLDMFISLESRNAEFCVEASQYTLTAGSGTETFEDDLCITRNTGSGQPVVEVDYNQGPNASLTFSNVAATGDFELREETPDGDVVRRGNASANANYYVSLAREINNTEGNSAALNVSVRLPTATPALDGMNFRLQGVGVEFNETGSQAFTDFRAATLSFSDTGSGLQVNLGNVRKDVFTQPGQDSQDREAPRRSVDRTGIASLPITVTNNGRVRGEMLSGGAVVRLNGFVDVSGEVFIGQLITENAEGNEGSAMFIYGTPTAEVAVRPEDAALRAALNGGWELSGVPAGGGDFSEAAFLVFGADNEYHQVDIDDPNNGSGYEFGTFTVSNGELDVEGLVDENGDSGLVDRGDGERSNRFPISVVGNTLTLTVTGEGDFEFTRIVSTSGSLPGCWDIDPAQDEGEVVLCYLSGNRYLGIQPVERNGDIGVEFGTYTINGRDLNHSANVDTSRGSLLSDDGQSETIDFTVAGDALNFAGGGEDDPFDVDFTRVQ